MSRIIDGVMEDLRSLAAKIRAQVKDLDRRKLLIASVPYVLAGYACDKVAWLYNGMRGAPLEKAMDTAASLHLAFASPLPSPYPEDLLFGALCGAGFRLAVYLKAKNAKKFRQGSEYGSARWGTQKDIAPYMDPIFENNVILTSTERLMCSFPSIGATKFAKPSHPKYARNKNVLVIGDNRIIGLSHLTFRNEKAA